MDRWLFVCTGNTCRSPMAAALARTLASEHPIEVRSAGLAAAADAPAAAFAQKAVATYGADLAEHRARQLSADDVRWATRILTMTGAQRDAVCRMFPEAADKVAMMDETDIADPIGLPEEAYAACAERLWQRLQALLAERSQSNGG